MPHTRVLSVQFPLDVGAEAGGVHQEPEAAPHPCQLVQDGLVAFNPTQLVLGPDLAGHSGEDDGDQGLMKSVVSDASWCMEEQSETDGGQVGGDPDQGVGVQVELLLERDDHRALL